MESSHGRGGGGPRVLLGLACWNDSWWKKYTQTKTKKKQGLARLVWVQSTSRVQHWRRLEQFEFAIHVVLVYTTSWDVTICLQLWCRLRWNGHIGFLLWTFLAPSFGIENVVSNLQDWAMSAEKRTPPRGSEMSGFPRSYLSSLLLYLTLASCIFISWASSHLAYTGWTMHSCSLLRAAWNENVGSDHVCDAAAPKELEMLGPSVLQNTQENVIVCSFGGLHTGSLERLLRLLLGV